MVRFFCVIKIPSHTHTRGSQNITGMFYATKIHYNNSYYDINNTNRNSGAFYVGDVELSTGSVGIEPSGNTVPAGMLFDASRSWTGESII